jgi:hypothetical protein
MAEREVARGGISGLEAVTAFNRPVFQAHAEIVRIVRQRLGDGTAALFARPVLSGDEISWLTDQPGDIRRWRDLPAEERATLEPLRAALDGQLSDLATSLGGGGLNTREGNIGHVLEAALIAPGVDHLYLVGGQPVLAFWGFRGVGQRGLSPLRSAFPEPAPAAPPVPSRGRLWWLAALLALLLAALLLWWLWPRPAEPPPPIAKPEPPPPAPQTDLPRQRWDAHDLAMLKGCWSLGHDGPAQRYDAQGNVFDRGITRAGEICFDASGHGQRWSVQEFSSGHIYCTAPVTTSFDDKGRLVSRQPGVACTGDTQSNWLARTMVCIRRDDTTADCIDHNEYGDYPFEFRRKE